MGMVGQFTPALKAGGDISPYRFVTFSATGLDNTVVEAPILDKQSIGISAGGNTAFDSAKHALTGEEVRLQPGLVMRVEAGGTIDAGDFVAPSTDGKAIAPILISGERYAYAKALEDAVDGQIFDVLWLGQVNVNTATD